ncbi:hypothetical protein O0L34_g9996 [Tuta absoluta]|nr:hypothetical protein O0L34_g9996 [Tuta absoluta]
MTSSSLKVPLQKERDNRAADKRDLTFHPYTITPETVNSAVLILDTKEPELLCQTLRAITKFAGQDMANRHMLYQLDAIKHILPHIDHSETNIRRFALKALAQMCQLPRGPEQVLDDWANLRRVCVMLAKSEDVFVQEFASLVLAELTREPLGCEQLIAANVTNAMFNRMKNSPDPDVQKNCLQILANVNDDPVCAAEMTKSNQFQWPPLFHLMQSKYVAIQALALFTVDRLLGRYKDVSVQKSFKASTGVLELCDILESYEFRDAHSQVLGVLKTYVETDDNAAHVYQSGCVNRLLAYLELALPAMKPHCIAVLCKMSHTASGREALFENGTDLVFCHYLVSSSTELLEDTAIGVANMCKLYPAAVRMSETNVVEALAGIISDEATPWFNIRINALIALSTLVRIIERSAALIADPKNFQILRNINKKGTAPIEAQRLAVQCFINLLNYHASTKPMLNADFIKELLDTLHKIDIRLKILTCTVLTGLMADEAAKHIFTLRKGEVVVANNLPIEHVGLRTALCTLITTSVTEEGADIYLELGTLHYMIEEKKARYTVCAWEPAIEAIFRHHPSAKLAYTGRLEINDFTTEGFYVLKRLGDSFPTMAEILASPPPYTNPVLVTMFYPAPHNHSSYDIRTPYSADLASRIRMHSTSAPSQASRCRLPNIPDDINLRDYLLKLRIWFGDPTKSLHYLQIADAQYEVRYREKCSEVSMTLKHRARLLGEFVSVEMSGLSQERDCSLPSVELAVADLMLELKSRVIGIGFIKCGGALERAILYKVLADRVGLPCALFRATSAHAWCEVAVPELDPEDDPDNNDKFPAGLLRANYVVDLMIQPGRLIPRSSHEAQRICGPPCAPLYVARCPPVACVCHPRERHHSASSDEYTMQRSLIGTP